MVGLITLLPESKIENYDQTDEINIGLQSSTSTKKNQEITLVMGSDDEAVITSVLAFQENINSNIIVKKKDSILTSDSNDILVIFSHGTEKGMIINDKLISWAKLSILLSQTNAKFIFLATCFGANIYNFTENTDKIIFGWRGVSDAIMMGDVIALLVNAQFQYLDDAQANLNLLIDRYCQISEHPEQIIPLLSTKIERIDTRVWIIPGIWSILIVSSVVLHMKFSPSEVSTIGGAGNLLTIIWTLIGMFVGFFQLGGPWMAVFFGIVSLQIINILLALNTSKDHHPNNAAWISFEFFGLPPIGSYIHGMAPSGSTVYNFLLSPDIIMAMILYGVFELMIHDWTWWLI